MSDLCNAPLQDGSRCVRSGTHTGDCASKIPATMKIGDIVFALEEKRCPGRSRDPWGHPLRCRQIWTLGNSGHEQAFGKRIAYCRDDGADFERVEAFVQDRAKTLSERQRQRSAARSREEHLGAVLREHDPLQAVEIAAKGEHDDTPSLYAVRWLRTLLDWCRDNPLVQQAISEDEDPSAVMEHFTVVRLMDEALIEALKKLDELRTK